MWNIDLTLVDVARVSRDAYAEAFQRATGRRLVALPQLAGASDSEIFFESLALNEASPGASSVWAPGNDTRDVVWQPTDGELLERYSAALAAAFGARSELLAEQGRLLPGALEALVALSRLPGVIQSVITGTIRQNAGHKLRAFGLDRYLDPDIGGFGSDVYPKGTQIMRSLDLAKEKYRVPLTPRRRRVRGRLGQGRGCRQGRQGALRRGGERPVHLGRAARGGRRPGAR